MLIFSSFLQFNPLLKPLLHIFRPSAPAFDNPAMAEVENPANQVPPHKKQLPSSMPNFDTLEGFATDGTDDYSTFKKLQRQLEYV